MQDKTISQYPSVSTEKQHSIFCCMYDFVVAFKNNLGEQNVIIVMTQLLWCVSIFHCIYLIGAYEEKEFEAFDALDFRYAPCREVGQQATLSSFIHECTTITEICGRSSVFTKELLKVFASNPIEQKQYLCIGNEFPNEKSFHDFERFSENHHINFAFWRINDAYIEIEATDFLFIDSLRTYHHLMHELNTFSKNVQKYICIPHIYVDGVPLEIEEFYPGNYSEYPDLSCDKTKKGVWRAVQDFLALHPEWVLSEPYLAEHGCAILERVNGKTPSFVLHPLVGYYLKNKVILCSGPSLKQFDLLKRTVESELQLIPYKKIFVSTNDPKVMHITFGNRKPLCEFIGENGHYLDCMNAIISSLKNAVNDPEVENDDIILFKHESVFLNDLGLFKRAVSTLLSGFEMVVRIWPQGSTSDIFIVKAGAIRDIINHMQVFNKVGSDFCVECFFHKHIVSHVSNVYPVFIGEAPFTNPSNYSHWKHTALGFYHIYRHSARTIIPSKDCVGQKWWDKKDYNALFDVNVVYPIHQLKMYYTLDECIKGQTDAWKCMEAEKKTQLIHGTGLINTCK